MQNFLSLQEHCFHPNSFTSGIFGNLFSLCSTNKEQQQALNLQVALIKSSNASISNADAKQILCQKFIYPASIDLSINFEA